MSKKGLLILPAVVLCFVLPERGSAQTLQNSGFEAPYSGSGNTVVANGWTAFRISQNPQFLQSTGEKIEGYSSQQLQTNGSTYDAGVYRQVTGCTPGARYRLAGWLCTSYDHAFTVVRYSPDGVMVKWVGVDPYGGTDPTSPNVIWSWEEPMDRRWRRLMVDFTAQSSVVAVFGRVRNQGNIGYDLTWIDAFEFAPSSYVRISSIGVRPGTNGATITWTTDLPSDSKVRYWKWQTTDMSDKNPMEVAGPSGVTEHSVTITGLTPDRKYYFEVVSKSPGTPLVQETIAGGRMFSTMSGQYFPTLKEAKNNPDSTRVYVNDLIVSAGTDQFTDSFSVQQQDRTNGIRVEKGDYEVRAGDMICLAGTLSTVSGERRLTSPALGVVMSGQPPRPLAHGNRTIGGGAAGPYDPGVTGGSGPNNIGVLVTVWGRITAVDPVSRFFYVDDGRGLEDGTMAGRKGLRVSWNGMIGAAGAVQGRYAVATGLSSCFQYSGNTLPQVLLRSPVDLRQY